MKLTEFFLGQAVQALSLHRSANAGPDSEADNRARLTHVLSELQGEVKNLRLPLSKIVERFNTRLSAKSLLTSHKISAMLRGLGLTTKPGTNNLAYLVWDEAVLGKLLGSNLTS